MVNEIYTVTVSIADLVENPESNLQIGRGDSQLLFGETVETLRPPSPAIQNSEGWSYVKSNIDGYKGFLSTSFLTSDSQEPTHFISHPWAHIYPEPSFKTRPVMGIGMMSRLNIEQEQEGFAGVLNTGWVSTEHIRPLESLTPDTDFVETALSFLGCPYLYGGRSALGLDCSALVQLALLRSGIPCPRDSTQQAGLRSAAGRDTIQRGDLVFFAGHVGIMTDTENILNATSRTMDVRTEKLVALEKTYGGITDIRRLIQG